jgi:deazaflavin-dependent oxidoreductase (nitroreductase family)
MNVFMKTGNFFMKVLLGSPIHGILSKNTLLISFTGRKTGKTYTTPVNYTQDENTIWITRNRERVWWRNLVGGASVTLRLRGKKFRGQAEVFQDEKSVAQGLLAFLKPNPSNAKYFDIDLNDSGLPKAGDVLKAAAKRVVIKISLQI